jgi:hypothetical protein
MKSYGSDRTEADTGEPRTFTGGLGSPDQELNADSRKLLCKEGEPVPMRA